MMNIKQIENTIQTLLKQNAIPHYTYGITGSFVRGEQTKKSDIDIVVKDGLLSIDEMESIKLAFTRDVDILQLELLKKEDEELDQMLQNMGLPKNNDSVYKTILREVVWIEKPQKRRDVTTNNK